MSGVQNTVTIAEITGSTTTMKFRGYFSVRPVAVVVDSTDIAVGACKFLGSTYSISVSKVAEH